MRKIDPRGIPFGMVKIETENATLVQHLVAVLENTTAQLGSLQIRQNRNRSAHFFLDTADHCMAFTNIGMRAVAHVQAEHIGPGNEQILNHFAGIRGRTESRHDFNISLSTHLFFFHSYNSGGPWGDI